MSQTTRQLVSKIQNIAAKPQANWTPIHQNLAKEYTTLVAALADRATVVEFQFDLDEPAQAKMALKYPTDLLEELQLLQFPMRTVWENMLQNRGISTRLLPESTPLINISRKLAQGNNTKAGTKKRKGPSAVSGSFANGEPDFPMEDGSGEEDWKQWRQKIRDEAGFAPKRSPISIRILPLALGIGVVSGALLVLALVGPTLVKGINKPVAKGAPDDQEPLDPNLLLIPGGENARPAIPPPPVPKPDKNVDAPDLRKANTPPFPDPLNPRNGDASNKKPASPDKPKKMPADGEEMDKKPDPMDKPEPEENKPKEPPPGSIRMPQIAQLGTLLDKNGPVGSTVKSMLEIDGDIANQKALDRFLSFVRADNGLIGRKSLTLPEFLAMTSWIKPLGREKILLFDPDRLDRCSKSGPRAEEELATWIASATLTPNAFVLVDPKRQTIELEALLGIAANEKVLVDLLSAIDKRVITEKDPKNGTPLKIAVRYQVLLQQKRELKDRNNQDLTQDVSLVRGELARRLKALGNSGIK